MREYELFYLIGESKEPVLDTIRAEVEGICREEGAEFLAPETQDKRKLAYEVGDETRGIYIARRFTLPDKSELSAKEFEVEMAKGDAITRMNRKFALSKTVLRVLIMRADTLPELKPIERTEYTKKDPRARGNFRRERPTGDAHSATTSPAPIAPVAPAKEASKEEIDAQLKAKLDI
ncbi:MAG: 30S ribosomal protein S6 [Candidatus Moraniibacteriota bacterium]